MQKHSTEQRMVRPAFDTLREIRDGACIDELATAINELTERVALTRRGGKVTLTISIAPAPKSEIAVVVDDDIVVKLPQLPKPSTIMFITEDNNVQLKHPKQRDLALRPVEAPSAPERESNTK